MKQKAKAITLKHISISFLFDREMTSKKEILVPFKNHALGSQGRAQVELIILHTHIKKLILWNTL